MNQSLNVLCVIALHVLVCRAMYLALTVTEIDSPGGNRRYACPLLQFDGKMLDSCKILVWDVDPCDLGVVMQVRRDLSRLRKELYR